MNKGDIVRLRDRDGLWVFAGLCASYIPSNAIGKFVKATHIDPQNPHETISIGIVSAALVTSPSFTPGETVTHEHQPATVESDDGSTVVLTYTRRVGVPPRFYAGEKFTQQEGRVDANRAQLVIGNIGKFIA